MATPATPTPLAARLTHQTYLVRRKVLTLVGAQFHVYDPMGALLFFSKLKAFKLKEDIRLYTGEDMRQELLVIKARQILDISATYDVRDSTAGGEGGGQKVGALRRRGLKSIVRDEWAILDANDQEIGTIREDSLFLSLLRRLLTSLVPQDFRVEMRGTRIAKFKQNFNPFVLKLTVDLTDDPKGLLDRRLAIAAAILLCAIEGRQG